MKYIYVRRNSKHCENLTEIETCIKIKTAKR